MKTMFSPGWRRALIAATAAVAISASPKVLSAQVMNTESATEVRRVFVEDLDTLQARFIALANAFPDDKYAWRPAPGVRSVGEAFLHVASEYYVYTPMAYGLAPSPVIPRAQGAMAEFEKKSTRVDVMKHLTEGFAYMRGQLTGADIAQLTGKRKLFGGDRTIAETTIGMSADLHEHLGQLIAYARMNGIKPPWSK